MATYYVRDSAVGANDGSSMADAFTSIQDIDGLGTNIEGDTILIASDHDESTTPFDIGGSGSDDWIRVISVDPVTEAYSPGASISASGIIGFGYCHVVGVTLSSTGNFDTANSREPIIFEDCDLTFEQISAFSSVGYVELIDCVVTSTSVSAPFQIAGIRMFGGSVTANSLSTNDAIFNAVSIAAAYAMFFGVDFSSLSSSVSLHRSGSSGGSLEVVRFVDCLFPAGWTFPTSKPSLPAPYELTAIGCGLVGETVSPAINFFHEEYGGYIETDTAVYRDGGASDGTTDYSWKVTCNEENDSYLGRRVRSGSEGITVFVEPGDTNIRIHLAHDAVGAGTAGRLTDEEVFAQYAGPSQAGTPTHQGHFIVADRARFGETASDLTDDGVSTWTGSGVGTKQIIDIPIAPTVAGAASVTVNFALSSASGVDVHFCPKLEVT